MPREPNPCNREVKREEAYEVWALPDLSWIWYVLRKYQSPTHEAKNPYARWYCNVVSPMTSERGETGDVYVSEIKQYAVKLDWNPLCKPYRFMPDRFWEALRLVGGDGYDDMAVAERLGWRAIADWGKDGWNLGSWPLVIVFFREREGRFDVAEYVEGDVSQWSCPTEAIRQQVTDNLAFCHWQQQGKAWVSDYDSFAAVPTDSPLRGPYRG